MYKTRRKDIDSMKKFLSVLLAVAMVISVVSVVSFAADEFKQIIKYDFEDEKAPDGYQGTNAKVVYVTESGQGKVLKFTTTKAWESPYFELGPAIKQAMADNKMEACTVKISLDAKTVESDGKARLLLRNVKNRATKEDVAQAGGDKPENFVIYAGIDGNKSADAFNDDWETYEFEFYMNSADAAAINNEDGDKYRLMFDTMSGSTMGMYIDNLTVSIKGEKTAENKVPTGVTFTVKNDINISSNEGQYICSPANIVSDKDVKDNKLTKTLLIKNNGEDDVTVVFRIQAEVKGADGNPTWTGNPNDMVPVVIEPGKTESVTYTADVADGSVTILDQKVALKDLFLRFDIYHLDGDYALAAGTSFTVFCDSDTAMTLSKATQMPNADKIGIELSYEKNGKPNGTGDMLPVAIVVTAVVSAVALAVVSRKKKEEI